MALKQWLHEEQKETGRSHNEYVVLIRLSFPLCNQKNTEGLSMSRYSKGWCKFPRPWLSISRRDPFLRALIATLCAWAKPDDDPDPIIQTGQILTSDNELAAEMACDRTTIMRKLKFLAKHGFLTLDRHGKRGRIISITHLFVPNAHTSCTSNATSDPLESQGFQENDVPNLHGFCPDVATHSEKEKQKEKEGEGNARARSAPKTPPFLNSNKELKTIIPIRPEISINPPPEDLNPLTIGWHRRCQELAPIRRFSITEISSQIRKLKACGYSEEQLSQILRFIEKDKIGQKFIAPIDGFKDHFDLPLIEAAYSKYKNSPEGKLQEAKKVQTASSNGKETLRERLQRETLENSKRAIDKLKLEGKL